MAKAAIKTYSSKSEVVESSEPQTGYASTSIQGALCDSAAELETLTHIIDSLTGRLRDVSTDKETADPGLNQAVALGDCALATQVVSITDRLRQANNRLTAMLQNLRL